MGVGCRVDDDRVVLPLGFLNPGDQFPFDVGLLEGHAHSPGFCLGLDECLDLGEGRGSVFFGLACAEKVQVRPVQEEDLHSDVGRLGMLRGVVDLICVAAQPAEQEERHPGDGGDVETELDESLRKHSEQPQPDRELQRIA